MPTLPHLLDAAEQQVVDQESLAKFVEEGIEEDDAAIECCGVVDSDESQYALLQSVRLDIHRILARMHPRDLTVRKLVDAFKHPRIEEQLSVLRDPTDVRICVSEIFREVAGEALAAALTGTEAFEGLDPEDEEDENRIVAIIEEYAHELAERHGCGLPDIVEMAGDVPPDVQEEQLVKQYLDAADDVRVDLFEVLQSFDADSEILDDEFVAEDDDDPIRPVDTDHEEAIRNVLSALRNLCPTVSLPSVMELLEDEEVAFHLPTHPDEREACAHYVFYRIAEHALLRAEHAERILGKAPSANDMATYVLLLMERHGVSEDAEYAETDDGEDAYGECDDDEVLTWSGRVRDEPDGARDWEQVGEWTDDEGRDEDDEDGEDEPIVTPADIAPDARERILDRALDARVPMDVLHASLLRVRAELGDAHGIDGGGSRLLYQRTHEDLLLRLGTMHPDATLSLNELLELRDAPAVSMLLGRLPERQRAACFVAAFCSIAEDALYLVDEFSDAVDAVTEEEANGLGIEAFVADFVRALLERCNLV